jgi:hypothetical protein
MDSERIQRTLGFFDEGVVQVLLGGLKEPVRGPGKHVAQVGRRHAGRRFSAAPCEAAFAVPGEASPRFEAPI